MDNQEKGRVERQNKTKQKKILKKQTNKKIKQKKKSQNRWGLRLDLLPFQYQFQLEHAWTYKMPRGDWKFVDIRVYIKSVSWGGGKTRVPLNCVSMMQYTWKDHLVCSLPSKKPL